MSECVVRMEMPKSCKKCKSTLCLWTIDDCETMDTIAAVQNFRKENNDGFPDFCPIICQLPEGHGDLVDWKDVEKELDRLFCSVVDDVLCMGPYMLKRKEYPQALIERPIRVNIIVPADTAERSE